MNLNFGSHWRAFLVLLCLLASYAHAEPILRDQMARAAPGDFIVAAQNKLYTLLLIQARAGAILTIEEVTVPAQRLPNIPSSWQGWLNNGALGHTCWVRYRLDYTKGTLIDCYSPATKQRCQSDEADLFLATLLRLNFTAVPATERKKIGNTPRGAPLDAKTFWHPPLIFEGKQIQGIAFDVWRTQWPRDHSELSGRLVEIYLPQKSIEANYPSYFPYWLEVQGFTGKAKVRIIDSGRSLSSPYP